MTDSLVGTNRIFSIPTEKAVRQHKEDDHKYRCVFTRDRDRILYSKEFRRLSGKTQVFIVGFDDHCRTRLTHTIEVSQIAKTISNALGLNGELTEAIAFGHDVGHTPFGHAGEYFLNLLMNGCYKVYDFDISSCASEKGFKHNWQSLRVVTDLEKIRDDYRGLNLTNFTRWGILHHTSLENSKCQYASDSDYCVPHDNTKQRCGYLHRKNVDSDYCTSNNCLSFYHNNVNNLLDNGSWSFEALVVAVSDEIAQRHHDVEDGITAGLFKMVDFVDFIEDKLPSLSSDENIQRLHRLKDSNESQLIPLLNSFIVNLLVSELVKNSMYELFKLKKEMSITNSNDFWVCRSSVQDSRYLSMIDYNSEFKEFDKVLKTFLYSRIVNSNLAQKMDGKSNFILRQLSKAYVTNPQQLPDMTIRTLIRNYDKRKNSPDSKLNNIQNDEPERLRLKELHSKCEPEYQCALLRTICDYIAGMTDSYAYKQYNSLYGTKIEW